MKKDSAGHGQGCLCSLGRKDAAGGAIQSWAVTSKRSFDTKKTNGGGACGAGHKLLEIYRLLEKHFGATGWWPGDSPFEISVGAILTQNTNWSNVEKALARIKAQGALSPQALYEMPEAELAELIRPAGYFRVKARRLRAFLRLVMEDLGGDFDGLLRLPAKRLRELLLRVHGIGPETADDIVLYAAGRPVFVVDAYTRRILGRHGLLRAAAPYEEIRSFLEGALPRRTKLFKEFHALIVYAGKHYCRKVPRCAVCPLGTIKPIVVDGGNGDIQSAGGRIESPHFP